MEDVVATGRSALTRSMRVGGVAPLWSTCLSSAAGKGLECSSNSTGCHGVW